MLKMYRNLSVLAAVASLILVGNLAQATTIGLWQFNEEAAGVQSTGFAGEFVDDSGNGHDGYAVGNPLPSYIADDVKNPTSAIALTRTGSGSSVSPNEDRVVVPHSDSFNLMLADIQAYTIEAVIKLSASDYGNYDYATILSTQAGVGYAFRVGRKSDSAGKLNFYIQGVSPNYTASFGLLGDTNIRDGEWHHVAVVIQPNADSALSSVTFYVDGIEDGTRLITDHMGTPTSWTNENIVNSNDLWIGDYHGQAVAQLVGGISMVRFSNAALTPDQFYVPEPSTLALLGMGLVGLLCYAWRKRK